MSHPNYTLEVISNHPKFTGKTLRKYDVEGIDTIGVWGDEPFSIVFKNNTWQKVQVKISLDGTDILTGKPADTQVSDKMWVVNAMDTMTLKCWPEDNNGGAAFIFTSADNSVAVHTHGNLSSRGIIAAAVFTEGHVPEPVRTREDHHHHHYHSWPYYVPYTYPTYPDYWWGGPLWINTCDVDTSGNSTFGTTVVCNNSLGGNSTYSCVNNVDITDSTSYNINSINNAQTASKSLESLAAIGAGEYTAQKITNVAGLIEPIFAETVRVRYVWWDDLVEKLRSRSSAEPQPSGFPGDGRKKNIDLKGTPRKGLSRDQRREEYVQQMTFARF